MNPEIKERWVAALRSGNYRQGTEKLAHQMTRTMPMKHCCLGVLCELAIEDGIIEAQSSRYGVSGQMRFYGNETDGWKSTSLPVAVMEWAGVPAADPILYDGMPCSEANDGDRHKGIACHSFDDIANIIEENF